MLALLLAFRDLIASIALLTLVFTAVEFFYPAEAQRLSRRGPNWLYLPIITAFVGALHILLRPFYAFVDGLGGGGIWMRFHVAGRNNATEILLTLLFVLLWDVWQYWIHRWQHASPILWETHKFHHSETALNVSAWGRHHASSHILYVISYAPMLLLFGRFAPHAIASFLMFRVWGFVNHANVRVSFGSFTGLIAGPQWHRIHHSIQPEHMNTNFAVLFPFIDRFFGTYYSPRLDEFPPTGLPVEEEKFVHQATISPLVGWSMRVRQLLRRPRYSAAS